MPDILSLGLFERGSRTLVAQRKVDQTPFAGGWLLPGGLVAGSDAMEEALRRHLSRELGVEAGEVEFAETLYLEDAAAAKRYVANVFRVRSYEGKLRVRAAGGYEDARWLTATELAEVAMPASLLVWLQGDRRPAPAAAVLAPAEGPAPDNRIGWNAISRSYQARYQLPTDRLVWGGRTPDESQLGLLGDVSGLKVAVLGCGGGQDCIVLAKQGAQVIGIDLSDKQIEYGRRLADREGVLVTLLQGSVEDLGRIDDESQDLAVSVHALNYVERADRAFAETYRVLRPGAAFVFSVHHPTDATLEDEPPFGVSKPYWQVEQDWQWDFSESGAVARMRSWYRSVADWFALLTDAGFRVERLLEPAPGEAGDEPWRELGTTRGKSELIPDTLIIKARKL